MSISEIKTYLSGEIKKETFPGFVYLVGNDKKIIESGYGGYKSIIPEKRRMCHDTVFDLASITKPLVTAAVIAKLFEMNMLDSEAVIKTYLPELKSTDKGKIKIIDLLTHSSGLMAWYPLFIRAHSPEESARFICAMPLHNAPGTKVEYSCMGYILLASIVKRVTGKSIIELYKEMILKKLQLKSVFFHSCEEKIKQAAATECGSEYEKKLASNMNLTFDKWRNYVMQGEVHDSNCYFLGGATGNSGMFCDVYDVYESARIFLEGTELFSQKSLALFYENRTSFDAEHRTAGWQLATSNNCGGRSLSPRAIGHSGFTGTSLWIEPEEKNIYILLTNRIHPYVTDIIMNDIRDRFHKLSIKLTKGATHGSHVRKS